MNSTTIPARVQARTRHDSRLQSMTLGVAALGIAATGVFSYAAALTYSGTATANAADQQAGLGDQGGTQPLVNNGAGSTSGGANPNAGGTTISPNTQNQQVTPPTTTRHRSHAVTGGS